jgi:hypothetical protein
MESNSDLKTHFSHFPGGLSLFLKNHFDKEFCYEFFCLNISKK